MIKHDSITQQRGQVVRKKQNTPPLPPSSEFTFLLIPAGCQPASPNILCTRISVFTPDSLIQVLHQNFSISKHQNSGAPSELMYYCILMKFIKMVISLCAVVHPISRRHAATHVSLCVRSSHTALMNHLLKSVFIITFGQCMLASLHTLF